MGKNIAIKHKYNLIYRHHITFCLTTNDKCNENKIVTNTSTQVITRKEILIKWCLKHLPKKLEDPIGKKVFKKF